MPEHRAVLQGKDPTEGCSIFLEYMQPHKQDAMPSLIIKLENPRIILRFRCALVPDNAWKILVHDVHYDMILEPGHATFWIHLLLAW